MTSFGILIVLVFQKIGTPQMATQTLSNTGDVDLSKIQPPSALSCVDWLSTVVLIALAGAIYPQSIHRIYAARSSRVLRQSLAVMAFLPLTTTLIAVLIGVIGAAQFPGLADEQADKILSLMCRVILEESVMG